MFRTFTAAIVALVGGIVVAGTPAPAAAPDTTTTTPALVTAPVADHAIVEVADTGADRLPVSLTPLCGDGLAATAIDVGWPVDQLATLDDVVHRESRCRPLAHNADDPNGGSYGLAQVNGYWCNTNRYNTAVGGWLGARGILDDCTDLHDPAVNLSAALLIWQRSGWGPWGGA